MFVRPCTPLAEIATFAQQPPSDEPLLVFWAYCTIVVAQIVLKQHLKNVLGHLCSVHWRKTPSLPYSLPASYGICTTTVRVLVQVLVLFFFCTVMTTVLVLVRVRETIHTQLEQFVLVLVLLRDRFHQARGAASTEYHATRPRCTNENGRVQYSTHTPCHTHTPW